MMIRKIFRFDDVSINTNYKKIHDMVEVLFNKFTNCEILLGVSPAVHDMSGFVGNKKERIFPEILNAYSDVRVFYNIDKIGIPNDIIDSISQKYRNVKLAGHGLIHADHRLLSREVQEASILLSCNLIKAKIFIPPFNKYNKYTEEICKEHKISLTKFEDGWTHLGYHKVSENANVDKYYLHTHDFTLETFIERIS